MAQPFHCLSPTTFLDSTLLNLYPTQLLLYRYDVAVSMPSSTLYAPLLCPTLFYSSLRFSTLLCYALLFSTLHNFILSLLYPYPTYTLPLLCLYSTSTLLLNLCLHLYLSPCKLLSTLGYSTPLYLYSTSTLPLLYYLHSASTQVPTGHNDLWASENVTSCSLNAGANWTQ